MPTINYAIERCGGAEFRAFKIITPEFTEPGFHRQAVSLSAFRSRELKRAFPQVKMADGTMGVPLNAKPRLFYSITDEHDLMWRVKMVRDSMAKIHLDFVIPDFGPDFINMGAQAIPLQVANSVFEFYEMIGYDYKNQKWLPTSQVQYFKNEFYQANALMEARLARLKYRTAPLKEPKV